MRLIACYSGELAVVDCVVRGKCLIGLYCAMGEGICNKCAKRKIKNYLVYLAGSKKLFSFVAMTECLQCGLEVPQKAGKRPKLFCNGNCRNKYYYKIKAADKPKKKVGRPKKIDDILNDPKVVAARKETVLNILGYGQSAVHIPSMTTGISVEDVQRKMNKPQELAYEEKQRLERIAVLESELNNPPSNPLIGKSKWIAVRQRELEQLKNELK